MMSQLSDLTIEQAADVLAFRTVLAQCSGRTKQADATGTISKAVNNYLLNPVTPGERAVQGVTGGVAAGGAVGLLRTLFQDKRKKKYLHNMLRDALIGGSLGGAYGAIQPLDTSKGMFSDVWHGSEGTQLRERILKARALETELADQGVTMTAKSNPEEYNLIHGTKLPADVQPLHKPYAGILQRLREIGKGFSSSPGEGVTSAWQQVSHPYAGLLGGAATSLAGHIAYRNLGASAADVKRYIRDNNNSSPGKPNPLSKYDDITKKYPASSENRAGQQKKVNWARVGNANAPVRKWRFGYDRLGHTGGLSRKTYGQIRKDIGAGRSLKHQGVMALISAIPGFIGTQAHPFVDQGYTPPPSLTESPLQ